MNTQSQLDRPTKFALMSAGAAGIVSFLMIATFIDMLTFLFVPCVMIMVFVAAYFAYRRQTRNERVLTGRRIWLIALDVGIFSHFYTFALYLPLWYLSEGETNFDLEIFGYYLLFTLIGGLASSVMFVWIAVPMYVGVGHILKAMEGENYPENRIPDASILDDLLEKD